MTLVKKCAVLLRQKLPDTDSHIVLHQACMQIPVLINIIQNRSVKGDHRQAQLKCSTSAIKDAGVCLVIMVKSAPSSII